jgi:hypothetical protein
LERRHADGGPGPELPRSAHRPPRRPRPGPRRAGGAAADPERVQVAAAALGVRHDPVRAPLPGPGLAERPALAGQDRGTSGRCCPRSGSRARARSPSRWRGREPAAASCSPTWRPATCLAWASA